MTKYMKTFKTDTKLGLLKFTGTPTTNDFDYKSFAIANGFNNLVTDSPGNTDKYGGVGFVVYKNYTESNEVEYYNQQRLEVLFVNELPVMYKIV